MATPLRVLSSACGAVDADRANVRAVPSMPPVGCLSDGMAIGAAIAAEAREWIGTPFHWQGRVKGVGCDCKGLIAGVAAAVGRPEADSLEALAGDYDLRVDVRRLKAGLARLFDPVLRQAQDEREVILPGDVLLLLCGGTASHLGIAISDSRMVHAMAAGPFKVIEAAIGRGRLVSVWRWRPDHAA